MNRTAVGVGVSVLVIAVVAIGAQFIPRGEPTSTEQGEQKLTLKVLVPQADSKVTVDKKEFAGDKAEREIEYATKAKTITVVATWEPNGYTKIVRTLKVNVKDAKDGVLEADLRVANDQKKDDITVIYVPTPDDVVEEMCKLGKVTKKDVVYDLGCGDGRMVITAVKKFGAKKGVGVDLDPERVKDSKENAKKAGVEDKVEFRKGDVLKIDDLPDATVVLLYMGEDINLRLRPILQAKLKPGSRVVSHRFKMGDWKPTQTLVYRGKEPNNYDYELLLWVIPEKKKVEPEKE